MANSEQFYGLYYFNIMWRWNYFHLCLRRDSRHLVITRLSPKSALKSAESGSGLHNIKLNFGEWILNLFHDPKHLSYPFWFSNFFISQKVT